MKAIAPLWQNLPGTAAEYDWLESRFAQPSVQDHYRVLAGVQCTKPQTLAQFINMSAQLDCFEVYYGLDTPEKLGRFIVVEREHMKENLLPFLDLHKIGEQYARRKGGAFIENGYAEPGYFPKTLYDGSNLTQLPKNSWAVRIKLSSQFCPEGVWVDFPSVDPMTGQENPAMALGELGVGKLTRCTLLDAQCRFENITDLVEQYDSVEDLYRACQNFGYVWEEQGQGIDYFEERWRAAMELEQCERLDFAMDIASNLNCYDFMPAEEKLEEYGEKMVRWKGLFKENSLLADAFDYERYAKAQVHALGLQSCAAGYVRRNESTFYYDFSKEPTPQKMQM